MKNYWLLLFFVCFSFWHLEHIYCQIPIHTVADLQKIGNSPDFPMDGYYFLTNDIDASITIFWNGGKGFKPIGEFINNEFMGVLDGKGYHINNLFIFRPEENFVGIFRSCYDSNTIVQNLELSNVMITGNKFVGSISGRCRKTNNCHVNGQIFGKSIIGGISGADGTLNYCSFSGFINASGNIIGGLIGTDGRIEDSWSSCTVKGESYVGGLIGDSGTIQKSYSCSNVTGLDHVGGLIGESGIIENSYANGNVIGQICVGGLAGINDGQVINCYSTAQVKGDDSTGALLGIVVVEPQDKVESCYFDKDVTGWTSGPLWTSGRSTDEMMNPATFKNWDFENVWWMIPGKTYPLLRPVKFVGVNIKPEQSFGLPAEYKIIFDEPVRSFIFDDVDLSLSTVGGIQGTLTPDDAPTTTTAMDCFTTWTLRLEDAATTTGLIVMRLPVAAAMNAANYPTAESAIIRLPLLQPALGDLNYDGEVNAFDRAILIEMILNPQSLWRSRLLPSEYDLNFDSRLDIGDVVYSIGEP